MNTKQEVSVRSDTIIWANDQRGKMLTVYPTKERGREYLADGTTTPVTGKEIALTLCWNASEWRRIPNPLNTIEEK